MSRHIVELTCGDPKSNQQTASKVECVINVNNHPGKRTPVQAHNIRTIDDTHVYESELEGVDESTDIEVGVAENGKQMKSKRCSAPDPDKEYSAPTKVRRSIREEPIERPKVTEGFIQTSTRPTITESEITSSFAVKDFLLDCFTHLLTGNDKLLNYNNKLGGGIILELNDLKHLIGTIVRLVEPDFEDDSVRVRVLENDLEIGSTGCCGFNKKNISIVKPLNEIASITLGNQDLKIHQFEAYHTIQDKLHIDLDHVFSVVRDQELNDPALGL